LASVGTVNFRLLYLTLLLAGCGAHARDAIVRSPEADSATWAASPTDPEHAADPFTGNGSGVRRIDAVLP